MSVTRTTRQSIGCPDNPHTMSAGFYERSTTSPTLMRPTVLREVVTAQLDGDTWRVTSYDVTVLGPTVKNNGEDAQRTTTRTLYERPMLPEDNLDSLPAGLRVLLAGPDRLIAL